MKLLLIIVFAAAQALAQDRIVYEVWNNSGGTDLYLTAPDGSFRTNLTHDPEGYRYLDPAISPDGKRLAISSNRNPNVWYRIYVIDLGGRPRMTDLTGNSLINYLDPEWSPDSQTLLFVDCDGPAGLPRACDMYTVNAGGGPIVPFPANTASDESSQHYSPDGTKIVFQSDRDGDPEIFVCDASGANVQQLTVNTIADEWPNWSPDGSKIIFSSRRDTGTHELYTMNADGSNVTRLTTNSSEDIEADFNSDGTRVVWTRKSATVPFPTHDIFEAPLSSMNAPRRLTTYNSDVGMSTTYGFVTRKVGRVRRPIF